MARAIALARTIEHSALDALRIAIVSGCAIALIAAGHFTPF
jgi:hypothetical protein